MPAEGASARRPRIGIRVAEEGPDAAAASRAERLAAELGLAVVKDESDLDAVLVVRADRLELRETQVARRGGQAAVWCEFAEGAFGHRVRSGHIAAELLVKAVRGRGGARGLKVVDATAGLGRDAALLALAGCEVTAVERSAVMAALLRDGLQRAAEAAAHGEAERQRLEPLGRIAVVVADARQWLAELPTAHRPDVVTLDPMFPPRSKSAQVKKQMRLCRLVSGGDEDAAELLAIAQQMARRRVVVKRPMHAEPLGGAKPTVSRKGRSVRYDVYVAG